MANQAIALQARAPQGNFLAPAIQQGAQFINMMSQQRAAERQAAVQQQQMEIQRAAEGRAARGEARQIVADDQERAKVRAGAIGSGLVGLLRDPSDEGLAQTIDTFKSLGMNPAEYQGVMAQLSKMPDANQRKMFALEFIAGSESARNALKFVAPNIKAEQIGDAKVFIDDNANSPNFGRELFRITASPEPVKLNQQVANDTLYNINPVTGVASEATIGDARAGLIPQPRTTTRTDTGVVSPYAIQNAAAAQVPAVAAAMRQFETGQRSARAAAPVAAPAAAPTGGLTVAEAARRKAAALVLPIIGYNVKTGTSRVEDLIKESTSGEVQMIGSKIMGAATGEGTPGRVALQQLRGIEKNMTFEKLRGKLGSAVSDRDVQLVSDTMADIANGNEPANVRLASWQNVVLPILLRGAGIEPKTPTASAGRQTPTAVPVLTPEQVRANPNIKRWRRADNGEVMTRP